MTINSIDPLSKAKRTLGKKLLLWAWIVELTTVAIAIFIATFVIYEKYNGQVLKSDYLNVFITILPFLVVVLIGIFKIPFIYLIRTYNSKLIKLLFTIILLILTIVTFEILRHGLEQYFHKPNIQLNKAQREIETLQLSINDTKLKIQNYSTVTAKSIEESINSQIDQENTIYKETIDKINNDKSKYTVHLDNPHKQINILKSRLIVYKENLNTKIDIAKKDFEIKKHRELELFKQQKSDKKDAITNQVSKLKYVKEDLIEYEESHSFYSEETESKISSMKKIIKTMNRVKDELTKEYDDFIFTSNLNIDDDLLVIYNKYNALITKAEMKIFKIENLLLKKHENRPFLLNINKQLREEEARHKESKQKIEEIEKQNIKKLSLNRQNIDLLKENLQQLFDKKDDMIQKIDNIYGKSLIYNITKKAYQKHRVTQEEVLLVSTIWFAVLSFILTFMGVILAFAAFILIFHDYKQIMMPNNNVKLLSRKSASWLD